MVVEDDCPVPVEVVATPGTHRNLSAWIISIPFVDFYDDEVKKERVPVFCIDVERHDREHGARQGVYHDRSERQPVYRCYLDTRWR